MLQKDGVCSIIGSLNLGCGLIVVVTVLEIKDGVKFSIHRRMDDRVAITT
jgi:hypothetical protein